MTVPRQPKSIVAQRAEERAQALAEAVVEAFTAKLRVEIEKHGGFLGIRHLDTVEAEFKAKSKQLSHAFAMALEDAAREQEELRWHAIKRPAFDRLMVKRFEHLLMHPGANGQVEGAISRRLLPGFFLALNMMLGPEALATYQRRSDKAVERVMAGQIPIDWDRVNTDGEIFDLIIDAQYAVAHHFEDPPKRFQWFIQVANSHMAPAPKNDGPKDNAEGAWELTHRSLHLLINSLLADLRAVAANDAAWKRFLTRHKGADRDTLRALLERLA